MDGHQRREECQIPAPPSTDGLQSSPHPARTTSEAATSTLAHGPSTRHDHHPLRLPCYAEPYPLSQTCIGNVTCSSSPPLHRPRSPQPPPIYTTTPPSPTFHPVNSVVQHIAFGGNGGPERDNVRYLGSRPDSLGPPPRCARSGHTTRKQGLLHLSPSLTKAHTYTTPSDGLGPCTLKTPNGSTAPVTRGATAATNSRIAGDYTTNIIGGPPRDVKMHLALDRHGVKRGIRRPLRAALPTCKPTCARIRCAAQ